MQNEDFFHCKKKREALKAELQTALMKKDMERVPALLSQIQTYEQKMALTIALLEDGFKKSARISDVLKALRAEKDPDIRDFLSSVTVNIVTRDGKTRTISAKAALKELEKGTLDTKRTDEANQERSQESDRELMALLKERQRLLVEELRKADERAKAVRAEAEKKRAATKEVSPDGTSLSKAEADRQRDNLRSDVENGRITAEEAYARAPERQEKTQEKTAAEKEAERKREEAAERLMGAGTAIAAALLTGDSIEHELRKTKGGKTHELEL